jgi:hypothetical protein
LLKEDGQILLKKLPLQLILSVKEHMRRATVSQNKKKRSSNSQLYKIFAWKKIKQNTMHLVQLVLFGSSQINFSCMLLLSVVNPYIAVTKIEFAALLLPL